MASPRTKIFPSSRGVSLFQTHAAYSFSLANAQFASLALTALAGAATPGLRVRATLDLTDRLIVDLAMATPHTLSRRCVGLLLNGAWIASLSRLSPCRGGERPEVAATPASAPSRRK